MLRFLPLHLVKERPACECGDEPRSNSAIKKQNIPYLVRTEQEESSESTRRVTPQSPEPRLLLPGLLFLILCSCALAPGSFQSRHSSDLAARNIKRIAIFPAQSPPAAEKRKAPYSAPTASGGSPIQEGGTSVLNNVLYSTMSALQGWQIVSDREVREVISQVPAGVESDQARELGELVYADAVIFPRLLRYRERVGEDLGVKSPASVAFVLDLWDVKRGDLVWSGRFDETQRSLSENVLAVGEYLHRGVKWLTAAELIQDGVREAMENLRQNLYRRRS